MPARTFELSRFSSRLYFFAVFEILGNLAAIFGVSSLVSLPFLAIVIRRLLCVPDYEVSSLNSS